MFDTITRGFRLARNRLAGLTELTESNIKPALREVRLSLLEADVELGVVKIFLDRVQQAAVGQTVETKVKHEGDVHRANATDQFVKICFDELAALMEFEAEPLYWAESGPTKFMLIGLQGSGKTTSCAKLARLLAEEGSQPLLVAADMQRPAAVEQLQVLGEQIGVPVFNIPGASPVEICAAASQEAAKTGCDVVICDTAGRLSIDEQLMGELTEIKAALEPQNTYLVVDAMIGQDAVKTAKNFNELLGITGVVLTKLDGDARGGAALSILEVTSAPIAFCGVGETADKFEPFRAEGIASRILGMGDVVGLMQDFEKVVDEKKAEEDAQRLLEGQFTLDDFLEQVEMIQQMGSLKDLIDKLPLGNIFPMGLPEGLNLDDRELLRIRAIIQSMTRSERFDPTVLIREPNRLQRVAGGSGTSPEHVQTVIQQFLFMKKMMSSMGEDTGLLGKLPGFKQVAGFRKLKKMMADGGLPGMPGFGTMGGLDALLDGDDDAESGPDGQLPDLSALSGLQGMPGMPEMPSLEQLVEPDGKADEEKITKPKPLSAAERNARKAQRKRHRGARKKGKR